MSLHDISVNHKRIAETETMPMTIVKMLNEILQKKIQTSTFQTGRGTHWTTIMGAADNNINGINMTSQAVLTYKLSYGRGNQISISTSSSTSDDASTIHTKSI